MRRVLLLGAAAASALLVVAWARGGGRAPISPPAGAPAGVRLPPLPDPVSSASVGAAGPTRNLFEYGPDGRAPKAARMADSARRHARAVVEESRGPDPVRWVGVVRRGDDVRVALSLLGEVVILARGETASGYTLLAVDEDAGARLRSPSGTEVTVSPEP